MDTAKKILLVEDEEVFIEMFGNKLKQDGYDITCAQNGAWGIKEALAGSFDLIIMDMVMPAMSGEEMLNKLKLDDETKNIPIVVLSASVDQATQDRVMASGVQEFFIKTHVTPSELSKRVAEILSSDKK